MMNSKVYKWCVVPKCDSTSIKTPDKLFVYVPHDRKMRNKWLSLARRDPKSVREKSSIYFCEDHFDLPKDMENYMEYHVMGMVSQVRMKPNCIPSKFNCQSNKRTRTSERPDNNIVKRERKILIEQCEKDLDKRTAAAKHLELGEASTGRTANKSRKDIKKNSIPTQNLPIRFTVQQKTSDQSVIEERSKRAKQKKVKQAPIELEIKVEPIDEEYEAPEQNNEIHLEEIKIEIEEHPVTSKLDVNVPVFMPCTRQTLPKINMFSIVEYIVHNDSFRDVDYKMLKADIVINAEDTIGNVQLHKMASQLTLQATVAFDTETAHVCVVKYDGLLHTIDYSNCECHLPACHHVLVQCKDYSVLRELQYTRLDGRQTFDACSDDDDSLILKQQLIHTLLNPDMHVEDEFIEKMKTTLEKQLNIEIIKCGIILNKDYPLFCALPSGFTNTHVVDFVYFENEEQIDEYIERNLLKQKIQFQLQFNMLLAKKEKSYFFIGFKE